MSFSAVAYELDQYQNEEITHKDIFWYPDGEPQFMAQSFMPSLTTLTKVEVQIWGSDFSGPIKISIRDDLNGDDLTSTSVNRSIVEYNCGWVHVDIPDIDVIPDKKYYIVATTFNGTYGWNNIYSFEGIDYYHRGNAWEYHNPNYGLIWTSIGVAPDYYVDFAFRTYSGYNNPPNKPTISGPNSGKIGEFYPYEVSTIEPDDEMIYYCIDWGDGDVMEEGTPRCPGDIYTYMNSWSEEGEYSIKVKTKDISGLESEWSNPLVVSIPKNKSMNNFNPWILRLIQRFPILELLI
jgi:hypothetical protein